MSKITATLRELIALGATGDTLLAAIERIEAAEIPPDPPDIQVDTTAEKRRAWDREYRRRRRDVHPNSGGIPPDPPDPPDIALSLTSKKERERGRGSRCPPDWVPTDQDRDFGLAQGLASKEIDREAEKFRDYWNAKAGAAGIKLDWSATWRNWVRRSLEQQRPNGKAPANVVIGEEVNGYKWTGSRWKPVNE